MAFALREILAALERIAPLGLAADWDNVGLLIDAPDPDADVGSCLLAIDLTDAVLDEAIAGGHRLVVAYHPPIFAKLSRLRANVAHERVVLRAARAGIAVYAPHTALDSVPGGVNDWLAGGLGDGVREPWDDDPSADPNAGQGRRIVLEEPVPLADLVVRIKRHLGLEHVRVATAGRHADGLPVERVLLCAGAGGSVLAPLPADVYWTGEMRHHDVLAALARGTSVILCEHSNTERGYLPVLRERLVDEIGGAVTVVISRADREPLRPA